MARPPFLQRGADETADEAADDGRAQHAPVVFVVVAVMVAAVVVVVLRLVVLRRRRVLRDLVFVGGPGRLDVSVSARGCFDDGLRRCLGGRLRGGCLGNVFRGGVRLGRLSGGCFAFARSAALGCRHGRSARLSHSSACSRPYGLRARLRGGYECAAQRECHHQFLQCVVHGRVPFARARKPILALTQSKGTGTALPDKKNSRRARTERKF